MELNEFQNRAAVTAVWNEEQLKVSPIVYCTLGLLGESGEVAEKVKKWIRGDKQELDKRNLCLEIFDAVWYATVLCKELGYTLEECVEMGLEKLQSRKERNLIKGSGDNR